MFPTDTIKTRLQSSQGFRKAGGFKGLFNGVGSACIGSVPTSALFFGTYNSVKYFGEQHGIAEAHSLAPMVWGAAAGLGELSACMARVPTENIKQKVQAR